MKRAIEIYIHIPFCVKKCDYCDFLSKVADDKEKTEYVKALLAEIRATKSPSNCEVISIFFGGGTPSILPSSLLSEIMAVLKERFIIANDAEITIECNPGTVDYEKLAQYKECGINRLSFGLQSTDNDELLRLGRIHTYEGFLKSYETARLVGFDNISIDLMSGLPGQSCSSWVEMLESVAVLKLTHISAYSLIVEEDTPFAKRELNLPDEDEERKMYEMTNEVLAKFGYHQYEISNYAKEGFACRHNIGYWKRVEYLGFGVGAASFLRRHCGLDLQSPLLSNGVRYNNIKDIKVYQENSSEVTKIRCDVEDLDEVDAMEEFVFLGLRMITGISDVEFKEEFGVSLRAVYGEMIDKLAAQGLLDFDEKILKLTRKGISVSNYVFGELLANEN